MRRHRDRRRVQRDQPGRRPGVDADRGAGGVGHPDAAVDDHVVMAAGRHLVAEVGDRDRGAVPVERGDQRGQVPVGVHPGGRAVVVDAIAVCGPAHGRRAGAARPAVRAAGVDPEAAAQALHDTLAVARPADHARIAERAVDSLAPGRTVRYARVRRGCRHGRDRGRHSRGHQRRRGCQREEGRFRRLCHGRPLPAASAGIPVAGFSFRRARRLAVRETARCGPPEEGRGAPEGLADGLARQPGLVLPVPRHLPLLPAGRERVEPGLGQ